MIRDGQFDGLRQDGWAFFPAAVSSDLARPALDAIEADRAHDYEPARQRDYDNISFCPDLRDKPPRHADPRRHERSTRG
jgi:hypothetical protein